MKKAFLIGISIINFVNLFAQSPVITRNEYFEIGDTIMSHYYTYADLSDSTSGAAGEDVLWDFSFVDSNLIVNDTIFYIDPVGTPFNPSFPPYDGSNLCYKTVGEESFSLTTNTYYYLFVDDDSLMHIGNWANNGGSETWEHHCTNLIKELSFPFSYQDQFIDSISCSYLDLAGGDWHYQEGINSVLADAYGTLITPDGKIHNNVLRVYSEQIFTDSSFLFGVEELVYRKHTWYASQSKGPIAIAQLRQDGTIIRLYHWEWQNEMLTSNEEPPIEKKQITIFPTLLNNNFIEVINNTDLQINYIQIFNTNGQILFEEQFNDYFRSKTIHIELTPGVYFARIFVNNQSYPYQIIKM